MVWRWLEKNYSYWLVSMIFWLTLQPVSFRCTGNLLTSALLIFRNAYLWHHGMHLSFFSSESLFPSLSTVMENSAEIILTDSLFNCFIVLAVIKCLHNIRTSCTSNSPFLTHIGTEKWWFSLFTLRRMLKEEQLKIKGFQERNRLG